MTPIRAAFTCSKACDIIAENTFSVASQHSIGHIDIKWARSEEHLKHPDGWLLFEHLLFVPKHVTLSQKIRLALLFSIPLAILTSSEQEVRSTWSTLTDDSYSSTFWLFQSMWQCRRRRVCVASQHSSVLFSRSKDTAWQELKWRYLWMSELRLEDLKTVTFYFWSLQEDHTPHKVTLAYLLETFSSF